MGCAGSTAAPAHPADFPADWKAKVGAVFSKLDKSGTGAIATVPHKKATAGDFFAEMTVLGESVLTKQLAMGDFAHSPAVTHVEFVELIKTKGTEKGWAPVGEFLDAVIAACSDESKGGWEQLARNVFKGLDANWCDPKDTGEVDFVKELKEIGDKTDEKAGTLVAGLEEGKKIKCDEWVAHISSKVDVADWMRVKKELMMITARLEKVNELDSMM
mmetsp:Transcript_9092/g.23798  ORF Transcript_9092/g.23798 Transcript_9092/m.23798 type:complete len:216 (+) Transcript_9092:57-704(+)